MKINLTEFSVSEHTCFLQYWYWFPLSHFLSLAFTPSCVIGLNENLDMPVMKIKSNAKPATYAYPPPLEEKKKEDKEKVYWHSSLSGLLSFAIWNFFSLTITNLKENGMSYDLLALETNTVVPGFRALGPSMAKSALNPGSALFPMLKLEHFEL